MDKNTKEEKKNTETDLNDVETRLEKLRVNAKQHIDQLSFVENFMNFLMANLIAYYIGFNLGVIGNTFVLLTTTYLVAPRLADMLLKRRVNMYVANNYKKMEESGKGRVQFFLYNHRYELTWDHIDFESE